jgi:hypothetical protein
MNLVLLMVLSLVGAGSIAYCAKKPDFSSAKRFSIGFFSQLSVTAVLYCSVMLYQIHIGNTYEISDLIFIFGGTLIICFITGVKCANAGD